MGVVNKETYCQPLDPQNRMRGAQDFCRVHNLLEAARSSRREFERKLQRCTTVLRQSCLKNDFSTLVESIFANIFEIIFIPMLSYWQKEVFQSSNAADAWVLTATL